MTKRRRPMTAGHDHEQRMLDWHGLRPSKAARCLRVVLGYHCVAYNRGRTDCLCLTLQRRLFDHVRIWLDYSGRHVLTSEPYDLTAESLRLLRHELAAFGIRVTVRDLSPWYPGQTTLLLMTHDDGMSRRETLGNWVRACLLDDRIDIEDKVTLSEVLDRMDALPEHTWQTVRTELLDDDDVTAAYAAVRTVAEHNPRLAEALANWELFHGHTLEESGRIDS